jgi:hypothetical protein
MSRRRIIDLSISIAPDLPSDPPMMIPTVNYVDHEAGGSQMKDFFPGLEREHLPAGLGWSLSPPTPAPTWMPPIITTPLWTRGKKR